MTLLRRARPLLLAALALAGPLGRLAAAGEAEARHGAWRDCLGRNFGPLAALSGPDPAADAAFRACRGAEDAYLAALAASPLLDGDDAGRARAALASRLRAWLVRDGGWAPARLIPSAGP